MGFVKYDQDGFVGVITINRPEALNALNTEVIQDLDAVLDSIDLGTTRVLVVTGAGEKSFVAGADIAAMSTMTVQEAREFSKAGNDVFRKLETLPIPSIAAVNGFALGGGNELAMSCDIRYCSENAMFGQPEVGLGITPGFGGTHTWIWWYTETCSSGKPWYGKADDLFCKKYQSRRSIPDRSCKRCMCEGRAYADSYEAGKEDRLQRTDCCQKFQGVPDRRLPFRP